MVSAPSDALSLKRVDVAGLHRLLPEVAPVSFLLVFSEKGFIFSLEIEGTTPPPPLVIRRSSPPLGLAHRQSSYGELNFPISPGSLCPSGGNVLIHIPKGEAGPCL